MRKRCWTMSIPARPSIRSLRSETANEPKQSGDQSGREELHQRRNRLIPRAVVARQFQAARRPGFHAELAAVADRTAAMARPARQAQGAIEIVGVLHHAVFETADRFE